MTTELDEITRELTEALALVMQEFSEEAKEMLTSLFEDILNRELVGAHSEEVLELARNLAGKRADMLVKNMTKQELMKLGEQLAEGLADGLNVAAMGRRLEEITGLDDMRARRVNDYRKGLALDGVIEPELSTLVDKFTEVQLRDRRELIANTEANDAVSKRAHLEAIDRGATHKLWDTAGDSRVNPEICVPNGDQGWITIDKSFLSGHEHPSGHPDCRCVILFKTEKKEKVKG